MEFATLPRVVGKRLVHILFSVIRASTAIDYRGKTDSGLFIFL